MFAATGSRKEKGQPESWPFSKLCDNLQRMELRQCTKEEFDAFLSAYPRELLPNTHLICEPPMRSFNDSTRGNWPNSMVAKVIFWKDADQAYGITPPREDAYYIPSEV